MDPTDIFQWPSVKDLKDHEECKSRCDSRKPTACEEGSIKGGRNSAQRRAISFGAKGSAQGKRRCAKLLERVEDARVDEGQKGR